MIDQWNNIRLSKNKPLGYVHTPKCGGNYVKSILVDLNVRCFYHSKTSDEEYNNHIVFTVFRDPIKRFESFLNYRLSNKLLIDFPKNTLMLITQNKIQNLDEVLNNLTDENILSFYPFATLNYWYHNIDIVISIDQIHEFLSFFGHNYDISKYKPKNISEKKYGTLSEQSIQRLKICLKDDILLYNKLFNIK